MQTELMKAEIERKLQWIERNFGGKPSPESPKINREACIKYIRENLNLLRFTSDRELSLITDIFKAIKSPLGKDSHAD